MTSPILLENWYTGGFLVREAPGFLSRDSAVIINGGGSDVTYQAGLVLSLDSPTTATAAALGSNTGNGTVGTIAVAAPAIAGAYVLNFESATAFVVDSPSGVEIGHGTVGSAFSAGGLGFTVTAGGNAFVAGDSLTITVAPGDGGFKSYTGAAPAAAILYNLVVVSAGTTKRVTVISRNAEVNAGELQWDPAVTGSGSVAALQASALAQLAAAGIVARQNPPSAG